MLVGWKQGLNDFAEQSTGSDNNGISWSERSSYTDIYPMTTLYNYAILDFFMYWILLWYFNNIIAGEWGTARKPWFFLVPSYWGYTSKKPKNIVAGKEPTYKEDVDVALERDQMKDPEKHGRHLALHIQNLTKTFWSDSIIRCHKKRAGFTAVDGVSFGMDEGTLLCLLGMLTHHRREIILPIVMMQNVSPCIVEMHHPPSYTSRTHLVGWLCRT